jgi:heme exporter protein B
MSFVRVMVAVAAKDVRVELRGRQAIGTALPFAVTLLIAFGLSLGPGRTLLEQTAPGLLWLAVLFTSVLTFRSSYETEGEDGALEGLLLAPVDKAAVFLGKAVAVTFQLLLLEAVAVFLVSVLFDLSFLGHLPGLAAALFLGTVGLSAIGSLFGVLTESVRGRENVLPLIVLPLCIPVLVAGVTATDLATGGRDGVGSWIGLLIAFDLIFLPAGTIVYGYLMED